MVHKTKRQQIHRRIDNRMMQQRIIEIDNVCDLTLIRRLILRVRLFISSVIHRRLFSAETFTQSDGDWGNADGYVVPLLNTVPFFVGKVACRWLLTRFHCVKMPALFIRNQCALPFTEIISRPGILDSSNFALVSPIPFTFALNLSFALCREHRFRRCCHCLTLFYSILAFYFRMFFYYSNNLCKCHCVRRIVYVYWVGPFKQMDDEKATPFINSAILFTLLCGPCHKLGWSA